MIKDKYWYLNRYLDKTIVEFAITIELRHHTRNHLKQIVGIIRKRLKAKEVINIPLMLTNMKIKLTNMKIKKVEPRILFTTPHPGNTPERDKKLKSGELKRCS